MDLPDAVTAVTAGHYHTLALTEAGEEALNALRGLTAGLAVRVMCERDPRSRLRGSQSPPAFSTTQVTRCITSQGQDSSLSLRAGELWAWGRNAAGKSGALTCMLPWCDACFTPSAAAAMQVSTAARMPAGQLGIGGRSKSDERTPLRVEPLAGEQFTATHRLHCLLPAYT